jgi:hypothetical protein
LPSELAGLGEINLDGLAAMVGEMGQAKEGVGVEDLEEEEIDESIADERVRRGHCPQGTSARERRQGADRRRSTEGGEIDDAAI